MTELPDYYAILGVPPTASRDEIRAAYRRLARRHHPDVKPPDEDGAAANAYMRRLNEAYDVLNAPRQRAAYDRQRWAGASPRQEIPHRPRPARAPSPDDDAWAPQTGGGRWRPSRARRQAYDQPMPGWLRNFLAVVEHLRMRLEPFSALIGVIVPLLGTAALLILGFWVYGEVQADPKAMGFLDCVIGAAGGIWVVFGVVGVAALFFLSVWFVIRQTFKG